MNEWAKERRRSELENRINPFAYFFCRKQFEMQMSFLFCSSFEEQFMEIKKRKNHQKPRRSLTRAVAGECAVRVCGDCGGH
jgi:hypothetical protein